MIGLYNENAKNVMLLWQMPSLQTSGYSDWKAASIHNFNENKAVV